MVHKIEKRPLIPSIDTVAGKAFYVRTEIEDKQGRWNDSYQTREGYYVIHEGKKHHVYKISPEDLKKDKQLRGI